MTEDLFILNIIRQDGSDSGRQIDISKLFDVEMHDHVIYLAIKSYLANKRQGTHKSKERSEIAGSTRKLFRQKGTGGARRGDIKSPLLRGGGRVFGPKPNEYNNKINKKEKRIALLSALKHRFMEHNVNVVEKFICDLPKTKDFIKMSDGLKMSNDKNLIIVSETNKNLLLSSRNVKNVDIKKYSDINAYDIVSHKKLYFDEASATLLSQSL